MDSLTIFMLGRWLADKYRAQAAKPWPHPMTPWGPNNARQQATLNMRKTGVPIELALAVLARKG